MNSDWYNINYEISDKLSSALRIEKHVGVHYCQMEMPGETRVENIRTGFYGSMTRNQRDPTSNYGATPYQQCEYIIN